MNDGASEDTRRQVEEKALQLHVLLDDEAEKPQHIDTDQNLGQFPTDRLLGTWQDGIKPQANKDC